MAKAKAWEELIQELNRDPWGRSYKVAMNKLRPWVPPPPTERLNPHLVERIVGTLFPNGNGCADPIPVKQTGEEWMEEMGVTNEEIVKAGRKLNAKKAPGPDGIPGVAWALAMKKLTSRLGSLFTECLRKGCFPREWKGARLVLIPKEGKDEDSPSAYRPICLLDEIGKMLERIIAERLTKHLSQKGPDLSSGQYGFRAGHSTVDAILRLRDLSGRAVEEGDVALAVSLDIANAFNTLSWDTIGRALDHHGVPAYLTAIIADYFRERKILYVDRTGRVRERMLMCGVPQGSVLGPLL